MKLQSGNDDLGGRRCGLKQLQYIQTTIEKSFAVPKLGKTQYLRGLFRSMNGQRFYATAACLFAANPNCSDCTTSILKL